MGSGLALRGGGACASRFKVPIAVAREAEEVSRGAIDAAREARELARSAETTTQRVQGVMEDVRRAFESLDSSSTAQVAELRRGFDEILEVSQSMQKLARDAQVLAEEAMTMAVAVDESTDAATARLDRKTDASVARIDEAESSL